VVGVLRPSGASIVAWGPAALNGRRQMDGSTVFAAASLPMVLTALLLVDAATRGEAALDDPLSAFAPSGAQVPGFGSRAIT
jgi:CubicO group peptidase (beta-lactamase class C family)